MSLYVIGTCLRRLHDDVHQAISVFQRGTLVVGENDDDHPLGGEWTVTVVGPHDAAALIARDCGSDVSDRERLFEYVITHDRSTVIAAARSLMQYIDAT